MGFKMVLDVAKWLVLLLGILLAFAAGFSCLLRDDMVSIGGLHAVKGLPDGAGGAADITGAGGIGSAAGVAGVVDATTKYGMRRLDSALPTCQRLLSDTDCGDAFDKTKCMEVLGKLTTWPGAIRLLFESSLTGDDFFDCAELVPHSRLLLSFAYLETVIVIILLVNMLIASRPARDVNQ